MYGLFCLDCEMRVAATYKTSKNAKRNFLYIKHIEMGCNVLIMEENALEEYIIENYYEKVEEDMKKNIHVVGAVIIDNDKILCAERGGGKNLPFKWEFPGGKIENGETPKEAIVREITEELKCKVEVGDQIIQTIYEYDFGIVHLTTFYCELISGSPVLTEHASIKWLSADELSTLDWAPADIPTIEILSNKISRV